MARRKPKKPRPIESYVKSARDNKKLVPSLSKYSRRKTLTRWQKSAITRAENKIAKQHDLYALTKAQAKALRDKSLLVGNGIRAIRLRSTSPDAKVSIVKGEIKVRSNGRRFHYIRADVSELITKGARVFDRFARPELWIWNKFGRENRGARSLAIWAERVNNYLAKYKNIEIFVQGFAYVENIR